MRDLMINLLLVQLNLYALVWTANRGRVFIGELLWMIQTRHKDDDEAHAWVNGLHDEPQKGKPDE